jgi:hypothetical protein
MDGLVISTSALAVENTSVPVVALLLELAAAGRSEPGARCPLVQAEDRRLALADAY